MIKRSLKGFSNEGLSVKTDTGGSKVSRERQLNSTTKTKRDSEMRSNDLGIFEGVLSRSKLRNGYRRYESLYREEECARTK